MTLREVLKDGRPLLFDGAMGTLYAARWGTEESGCEEACLCFPERITAIHRDYLAAGCRAVNTDTFSVCELIAAGKPEKAAKIVHAAVCCAKEATDGEALIFADMGPVPDEADAAAVRREALSLFLAEGIDDFLWETLSGDTGVAESAAWLKERNPAAGLIVSFAAGADGFTRGGEPVRELIRRTAALYAVDAVGLNCMSGPTHLLALMPGLDTCGKPLSVMPNAGYPTVLGRRVAFQGQPEHFARVMREIRLAGASILGGCCGTTPAHIAAMAEAVRDAVPHPRTETEIHADLADRESGRLIRTMEQGRKILAVELDPPKDDRAAPFMEAAAELHAAGADVLTLADCPVGRSRADSSLLACKLHRELGLEVLPHMTCRDRNLNAIKALLLGLGMEGIENLLIVTGDPIPAEDRSEVKSVYDFNSRKLAKYVAGLVGAGLTRPFTVWGALNINAANFSVQLRLAREKEENGMSGFLTQPVLSDAALDNLREAREKLNGKIVAGLYPPVSYRNACFLNNEVSGIRIQPDLIERYRDASREEGERIGREIVLHYAKEAIRTADGLYLTVPLRRIRYAADLSRELKALLSENQ